MGMTKTETQLETFVSFVQPNMLTVRSTARHTIHLQFNVSPTAFLIRAVQSVL
jgi:hypothetical protein